MYRKLSSESARLEQEELDIRCLQLLRATIHNEERKLPEDWEENAADNKKYVLHSASTPFLITTLPHAVYALQTPTCCLLLVFALPLAPVVLVLQSPQSGTHSHLAFATLSLPMPFIAFLKLTASSRPSAHPSASDSATG